MEFFGDAGSARGSEDRTGWEKKIRDSRPPVEILAVEGDAPQGSRVFADVHSRRIELHYQDFLYLESLEPAEGEDLERYEKEYVETTHGVTYARVTVAGPSHIIASNYEINGDRIDEEPEAVALLCEELISDPYPATVKMLALWQRPPEGVSCTIGASAEYPGAFDITVRSDTPKIWTLDFNYLRMDAPDLRSVLPGFEPVPEETPYETIALRICSRSREIPFALVPVDKQSF